MPMITVITRDGLQHEVQGSRDLTVMEAIRDAGLDELLAICGGCCSCATCHVFIEEGGEALPPMTLDEDDLLESSDHRSAQSRLSCQLPLSEAPQTLRVRIAPED